MYDNKKNKHIFLEKEEKCNLLLDELTRLGNNLKSDRLAMQSTIDAKQRLIEQQVLNTALPTYFF